MGEQLLFQYFGIPIGLWVVLYISDYYLTLWGASLYVKGGKEHLTIEGSYELNATFEKDIDLLRTISPRFLFFLLATTLVLLTARGLLRDLPALFIFFAGGLLLLETFVHLRHVRNIASMWSMSHDEGVSGRLEYKRWYTFRSSAIEAFTFASFLLVVALLGGSWFFAGGAFSCFSIGIRHTIKSRQLRKTQPLQNGQSQ